MIILKITLATFDMLIGIATMAQAKRSKSKLDKIGAYLIGSIFIINAFIILLGN